MKLCINCGIENQATASKCITCGLPLTDSFASGNQMSQAANPKMLVLMALAIAIAGLAGAIFMLSKGSVEKSTIDYTELPYDADDTHRIHEAEGAEQETARRPARVTHNLRNVSKPGKYVIDDTTLSRITAKVKHFIAMNNSEDVDAILNCFNYPVKRYHSEYNVSRVKMRKLLNFTNDTVHKLSPSLSAGTVSFDGRNYEVVFYARYMWTTTEEPDFKRTEQLRLKYIMNKNLQITSVYEM